MNFCLKCGIVGLVLFVAGCAGPGPRGTHAPARDAASAGAVYADALESLWPGLQPGVHPAAYQESIRVLDGLVQRAARPGGEAQRAALCHELILRGGPETPVEPRVRVLRALEAIGRDESVATLRRALSDADPAVRETARRALQANPAASADEALREALSDGDVDWQIALLAALGERRDTRGAEQIARWIDSPDARVATAAVRAIGGRGGPVAENTLTRLIEQRGAMAGAAGRSLLALAEQRVERGQRKPAAELCARVHSAADAAEVKRAALVVWLRAEGAQAWPQVETALDQESDLSIRATLLSSLRDSNDPATGRRLLERWARLTDGERVVALGVLADRRESAALPTVLREIDADEAPVRLAALQAVRTLGDDSAVDGVVRRAAASSGPLRDAARTALAEFGGESVDRRMIAALDGVAAAERRELLIALSARGSRRALPILVQRCSDEDETVRAAAFDGLSALGGPRELDAVIARLGGPEGVAREAALRAVIALSAPLGDPEARLKYVWERVPAGPAARADAMRLSARIGGPAGLERLRTGLSEHPPEVYDAAVRGLAAWPSDEVSDELLTIARSAADESHRRLALRGVLRLCGESVASESTRLSRIEAALALPLIEAEDRIAALGALRGCRTRDALSLIPRIDPLGAHRPEAFAAEVGVVRGMALIEPAVARQELERLKAAAPDEAAGKKVDDALRFVEELSGWLTAWQVAGPFAADPDSRTSLLAQGFAPETDASSVVWRVLDCGDADSAGKFDLLRCPELRGDQRCVYVRTRIWSDAAVPARLDLGSDDGVKVWLNDAVIHTQDVSRSYAPASDKVVIELREGWNDLLLKVSNVDGGWAFGAAIRAPDGAVLSALRHERHP